MDLRPFLNRFVVFGALITAGMLILVTIILIGWTSPRFSPDVGFAPADLTMIPAPSHTPAATAMPTTDPFASPTVDPAAIHIGGYVQIIEVGSDGLRIRSAPGLNSETVFLGGEAEVFLVKDGPQDADGHTWWHLVASYDDTRAGWAAAEFLSVVTAP